MDSRQIVTDFKHARAELLNISMTPVQAPFVVRLEQDVQAITPDQLRELQIAAQACTSLIESFTLLKKIIDKQQAAFQVKAPVHSEEKDITKAALRVFSSGKSFVNVLLASDGQEKQQLIDFVGEIIQNALAVVLTPENQKDRDDLNASITRLNSELETNPYLHACWTAGRVFVGALSCLLGAVMMVLGIVSGVALGFGLVTKGEHWGPLTVGKQFCVNGVNLMFSGPTKEERVRAQKLASRLTELVEPAEALAKKLS